MDFVIIVITVLLLLLFVIVWYFGGLPKMGQLTSMQNLVILGWWEVGPRKISEFVIIVIPLLSLLLFVIIKYLFNKIILEPSKELSKKISAI